MKTRFSLVLLLCALFMGFATSLAAGTEANTSIINQASATYTDSLNAPQSTTSNSVTTIVQQVYSFTILPDGETPATPGQTETALPGAPVYFNYTVTNTGNGDDTITLASVQDAADAFNLNNVTIYLDTGCDGSVAGDSPVTSLALGADASACLIVSGDIPTGTTDGLQANYNLVGTSSRPVTPDAPALVDNNNWARAEANTGANLNVTKTANPSSAVAAGGNISYTIQGSNNGGAAAYGVDVSEYTGVANSEGIVITDSLDDNLTYTAGTLTGTAGAGAVSFAYSTTDGVSWVQTEPATGVTDVAMIISAPTANTAFFPQSTNYTMSFSATVAATAAAGTTITNQAIVDYSVDDNEDTSDTATSNETSTDVAATSDVAIGPEGLATDNPISGTASYTDSNGNTWDVTLSGGFGNDDTQTLTSDVATGDTVAYRMSVANTGNVADTFDIDALSASGYTVQVFNANGTTPLNGALSIPAGDTRDIVVKVTIPAGATVGDTITVTATSTTDPDQFDTTFAVIPTPDVGYAVDIAQLNFSNDNNEANDTLGAESANPGETIDFPIEVTNTGEQTDTFDLSANLPVGWNVEFVVDANCDGVADAGGTTAADTGPLAPDATVCYVAQVTIPVSAPPSLDNPVSFTATSNGDPTVANTVAGTATVATTDALSFINDQSATTAADSVVTYTHTVINSGNATTSVSIAPQPATTEFTYQYAVDTNNDGDFSDETFFPGLDGAAGNGPAFDVAANDTQTVFVQVIVPGTATEGDDETVTITATGNYGGGSIATDSVQDTTTVLERELELVKSATTCTALNAAGSACDAATITDANGLAAEPGDYIEYEIVAENLGSADISNVKIIDPLPADTSYVLASVTSSLTGDVLYSTDGTTWSATAPAAGALLAGQSIYVSVDTSGDDTISDADTMEPGDDIVLTFLVQVQ